MPGQGKALKGRDGKAAVLKREQDKHADRQKDESIEQDHVEGTGQIAGHRTTFIQRAMPR